jgi:hypothetical protein
MERTEIEMPRPVPQKHFLVLISVKGWAIVQLEGLGKCEKEIQLPHWDWNP